VYRDIHQSAEARESLARADRLIVLQPEAAKELAPRARKKVKVVVQSSDSDLRHDPQPGKFRFCVIGHLRDEKDPLRAALALRLLQRKELEVIHLGKALDPGLAKQARQAMRGDKRYRWLGEVAHERTLRWLASSHAMIISSRMEGGANVVCEALRIGVPVLASRISGNVGLLGRDYAGYFPVEDEGALAGLMARAASDRRFYEKLKTQVKRLRAKVAPEAEAKALLAALSGLRSAAPAATRPDGLAASGRRGGDDTTIVQPAFEIATTAAHVRPESALVDSVLNHSEDVEFILDPVVLHRGRAQAPSRLQKGVQGEQAVISF